MRYLVLLFSLFLSISAFANDKYLFSPIGSYHIDRSSGECEFNPGLYYQHFKNDHIYFTGGVFRNSTCNTALIAMVGWETYEKKRFLGVRYGYGAMLGVTTGYSSPVMGAPYIRFGDREDRLHLKLMVLPHPTKGIIALGVSFRLGK